MCLRFWKLRAGGANKKRKIYYCRTMNSNVEVIGDMEPETALVFSAKAEDSNHKSYCLFFLCLNTLR